MKDWDGAAVRAWLESRVVAARSDQVAAERGGRERQDDCDKASAEEMVCSLLKVKVPADGPEPLLAELRALLDREDHIWRGVYDDTRFDRHVRAYVKKLVRMTKTTRASATPRITSDGASATSARTGRKRGNSPTVMTAIDQTLQDLGWDTHFGDQLLPDEAALCRPVRVMAVHRGAIAVAGAAWDGLVTPHIQGALPSDDHPTVGDWLLLDIDSGLPVRVLARRNLFKRRAPGDPRREQMIAANVDTVFLVASCNQDFSVARLERYLILARDVGVEAVVVLTKVDLTDTPEDFADAVRAMEPGLVVETVDAREPADVMRLAAWCGPGRTVAFLGSSGVGKSTLVNTLRGSDSIATQAIRENDGTGRHTTTVREMHRLDHGGWLLDLPGMRELQLSEAAAGIAEVFDDFEAAAAECRFSNCSHGGEPGCAVRAGIESGALTQERFDRWRILAAAEAAAALQAARRRPR